MEESLAKPSSHSRVTLVQVMLPEDANPAGNVHGGTIMKLIDNAAYVVASRHCRMNVVTASVDRINFHSPVFVGNLLHLKANLNWTGRTSMEIGVRVEAENLKTGELVHTASAYLTFVALGENGRPQPVPPVLLKTEEDKRRFEAAAERVRLRKTGVCRI